MAERLGLENLDAPTATSAERVPPRTRTEEVVLGVWAEVLDRPDLGVEDRFLDVGGDSMLAMRLLARIRELLGIDPSVVEFFDRATVAAQAELIDERLLDD
jgi:aryl carrier-like protein